MIYLKLSTMEYPRYEGDIRLEFPDIPIELTGESFPTPDEYVIVYVDERPDVSGDQYVAVGDVVNVDGVWRQTWVVKALTDEQKNSISQMQKKFMFKPRNIDVNGNPPNVIS